MFLQLYYLEKISCLADFISRLRVLQSVGIFSRQPFFLWCIIFCTTFVFRILPLLNKHLAPSVIKFCSLVMTTDSRLVFSEVSFFCLHQNAGHKCQPDFPIVFVNNNKAKVWLPSKSNIKQRPFFILGYFVLVCVGVHFLQVVLESQKIIMASFQNPAKSKKNITHHKGENLDLN